MSFENSGFYVAMAVVAGLYLLAALAKLLNGSGKDGY